MPEQQRPDPDRLLAEVADDERRQRRGKLRVFLGYAAGVGKTYAMLEAAHERLAERVDVVVGLVETHGRGETEALVAGLEVVPRAALEYRGVTLEDMDLDGVLRRSPTLVIVDELAHTNAPGSRHPKRYQDVEELLAAGINVYTTLNVQHLESLNDVVAQVTGVVVRETLPDSILDESDEIELVDLPPDELLHRLRDGKVYAPGQAELAAAGFFRVGNLFALREAVMRRAAQRVDSQMRAYMRLRAIPGPWPVTERLLVCVSQSPASETLIRSARRLADELGAEWHAVNVETPGHIELSDEDHGRLSRNLRLAEELGARTTSLPGRSVADTVVAFARDNNITKIVIGKSALPRWARMFRGSLSDELVRKSGDIDVVCISNIFSARGPRQPTPPRAAVAWMAYAKAAALVLLATAASWPAAGRLEPTNLVMVYLAVVLISAAYLGRGPSMLAALLSVAAFDFCFVEPRLTMAVSDAQYLLTFGGLLVVGLVTSHLAARLREQIERARERENQAASMYALSRDIAAATALERVLEATLYHTGQQVGYQAAVLLPRGESLEAVAASPGFSLDDHELTIAHWTFDHGQTAGHGTNTLPSTPVRFLPLHTATGTVGVLAVAAPAERRPYLPRQELLLEAFASVAALGVERIRLAERAGHIEALAAGERLQEALLHSISHDIRTPLACVTGVLSSLRGDGEEGRVPLSPEAQAELVETGWQQAERLNRLVGNLLDITRLETGAFRVDLGSCDLTDVVGSVLARFDRALSGRAVHVSIPADLPPVRADFVLLAQALANVLDNALKYSPPASPVDVQAATADASVVLSVADSGPGIDASDLPRVFDKFYRGKDAPPGTGTGLGLAIARGFVEAQGGTIDVEQRDTAGTVVRVALPLAAADGEAPP